MADTFKIEKARYIGNGSTDRGDIWHRAKFRNLYRCAKFGWNRFSSFDNMLVFRFRPFGLKMPIHAPNIGVLEDFTPKWEAYQGNL